ncbi:MAG: hypothetical protein HFE51_09520 [Clostridia bacterium]|nr:hypothetical protein [Clostridia bacterium]MCI9086639.1 hypothetical protein [Clostridia bacterium]
MYLFTKNELRKIAVNLQGKDDIIEKRTGYLKKNTLLVSKDGIADWGMYYRCPIDSAPLKFDFNSPHNHICSVCGNTVQGSKYDGAWWGIVHNTNAETAYHSALSYLIDGNEEDYQFASQILLSYARIYPDYEEHGDIPYNDKGKIFAQTLDEAVFLRQLSYAYDIIEHKLKDNERELIKNNLFRESAVFLSEHCGNQIHNHEVLIRSQIGILGIILEDEELIYKAVNEKYGLLYQLDNGVLNDGLWFEGSLSYHQYALSAFMAYEIFARHTKYSNLNNEKYPQMIKKQMDFINEDGTIPSLNDHCGVRQTVAPSLVLEFGYEWYKDNDMLTLLNAAYKHFKNRTLEAYFLGSSERKAASEIKPKMYHNETGSGITIFRGNNGKRLVLKHSPFGGEHDHYDRLSVEYSAYGSVNCLDLGTVPYGAVHHYGYFKNTVSHNTVTIDGKNHPPSVCTTEKFQNEAEHSFISVKTDFDLPVILPDSFVIKQWDNEVYRGVSLQRQILWCADYWIDVVVVINPKQRTADWNFHIDGEQEVQSAGITSSLGFEDSPYKYMKNTELAASCDIRKTCFKCGDAKLNIWSLCKDMEFFVSDAPNNPPTELLKHITIRNRKKKAVFVNVFEAYKKESIVKTVTMNVNNNYAEVIVNDKNYSFNI